MKKKVLSMVLACVTSLSLVACGSGSSTSVSESTGGAAVSSSKGEETVVNVAMTTTMGDLDPFGAPTQGRNFLRYAIYDNLAIFKDFGTTWDKMQWVIAKNIVQKDDTTYDIEIYDYVKDAAGNDITADDIVFCIESMANSGNFTRYTNYLDSVTKMDDYNVEIKLKTTTVGALEYILAQTCIVDKDTYEANKDQYSTEPITTGAYQVTECVQGASYTLEKNENYWQTDDSLRGYNTVANPGIDKFVYNIITENSQATMALQMGEDQLITVVGNNEISYFMDENGNALDGYNVSKTLNSTSTVLSFNMDPENSVFADNLALRQAICYAIDRDSIVKVGLQGNGEVMNDLADKLCADYNQDWESEDYYNYDLDQAKALMEDAGYKDGIDPATGQALSLSLLVDQQYKDAAVVLQSQLAAIGINLEINALDNSLCATYQFDPTKWDLYQFIQGTECYVTSVYDGIFEAGKDGRSPKSFAEDEQLQSLIKEAHDVSTHSQDSVDALHDYVKDNALAYGLYQGYTYSASVDSIGIVVHPWGQLVAPACDYSAYLAQ